MSKLKMLQVRFNDSEEDSKLVEIISKSKNKTKKLKDMARYGVDFKDKHEKLKELTLLTNERNSELMDENKKLQNQILELTETIRQQGLDLQKITEEQGKLQNTIIAQKASIQLLEQRGLWARLVNKKPKPLLENRSNLV